MIYSAFDNADGGGGHQFLRNPSSLNLYRRRAPPTRRPVCRVDAAGPACVQGRTKALCGACGACMQARRRR